MGLFRHPHLTRGVVHTPGGAFLIERGVAAVPDEIGEALGWARVDEDPEPAQAHVAVRAASRRRPDADHAGAA